MKKKESIVKLVFGCIDEVVSTTENIHSSIVKNVADTSKNGFQEGENGNMCTIQSNP